MSQREYDVVVYGATGYTGRLVAEYLATQYPSGLRWAMAGRSEDKLEAVRAEIGAPESTPFVIADASDPASLSAMAAQARVVITTVGPYQLYGEPLVRACAEAGADYVDLCGEPAWMHDIIRDYDEAARESGARIVLSCGFDSIPFDMGVFFLQEHAKSVSGAPVKRVKGRVRAMKGTFSGGTAASLGETMKRLKAEPEILSVLIDPFSLCPGFTGPEQPAGDKPVYEEDLSSWSAPFIMAAINTKNIHRSNFLSGHAYGEDFVYDEMMLTGDGDQGKILAEHVANDRSLSEKPLKPGEGPTKEERETGFYELMFTGLDANGERRTVSVKGDKDPGYGSTSKMIAEAALALLRDVDRSETPGGVLTSAPAMGAALIDRLQANAGLTFTVEA